MTNWNIPTVKREPQLLVGITRLAILTIDVAGAFTLEGMHAQVTGKVGPDRAIGSGYYEVETADCLAMLVACGVLRQRSPATGDDGPVFFIAGPEYPTRPQAVG